MKAERASRTAHFVTLGRAFADAGLSHVADFHDPTARVFLSEKGARLSALPTVPGQSFHGRLFVDHGDSFAGGKVVTRPMLRLDDGTSVALDLPDATIHLAGPVIA